jgi:hypothetical protein
MIKKKCVSCSYVKDRKKLVIVLREYCIKVNRLFVFQCFSNIFKRGSYKVEGGSLGLTEKGKISGKEEIVNKEAYKL